MRVKRKIAPRRDVPGRADGYLFFSLKWPSGREFHRSLCTRTVKHLMHVLDLFRRRTQLIPPEELTLATGVFEATIRRANGKLRRVRLGIWKGADSMEDFIKTVRSSWEGLPKEADDEGRLVEEEISL